MTKWIALTVVLLAAPLAKAEDNSKLALELVRLVVPPEAYKDSIDQMTTQLIASTQQMGAPLPPNAATEMRKVVEECMPYDEMTQWSADVYAKKFTAAELKDLMTFYKTPTGKKAARSLPSLMGEVGKKGGEVLMQRLPAAMKRHGLGPKQ